MGNAWCCGRGPDGEDGEGGRPYDLGDDSVDLSLDLSHASKPHQAVHTQDADAEGVMFSPRTMHRITALTEKEEDLSQMLDKGAKLFNDGQFVASQRMFKRVLDESRMLFSRCHNVQRLQERAPMQRALKAFEGKAMYNLAHSYLKLGDRIAALQFFQDCVPVVQKSGDWQVEVYCNMKVAQLSVDTEQRLSALQSVKSILEARRAPPTDIEQVEAKMEALRAASRSASPASFAPDDDDDDDGDDPAAAVSEEGVELIKDDAKAGDEAADKAEQGVKGSETAGSTDGPEGEAAGDDGAGQGAEGGDGSDGAPDNV